MKYFAPETKKAKKLAMFVKGLCGTLGTAAAIANHPYWGLGIFIAGAVADEAIKFLSDETDQNTPI